MLSKNSQKEYYSGVRKCYQRTILHTARRNITCSGVRKVLSKNSQKELLHTVELGSVIKVQPEGILHTVELESVIEEQPEGILHWS